MKINVNIAGVDGETNVHGESARASTALEFLKTHDHEGSSVTIVIETDDPAEGYELLDFVRAVQATKT